MDRKSTPALLALVTVVCCASCDSRSRPAEFDDQTIENLAELPGARQSTHGQLRDEIARITEEGGTPTQLARGDLLPIDNVAVALAKLFGKKSISQIDEKSEKLFPQGRFRFNPVSMENVYRFQQKHAVELEALDAALRRPACDFQVSFVHGFFADSSFVDTVSICVRLEAFRVAEHLAADQPTEMILPLRAMFRLIRMLAAERHVEARLAAAMLRADALRVVTSVAQHPGMTRAELIAVGQIIQDQLDTWPLDAGAWIGDRALTLHAYEVIRIGQVTLLLTDDEIQIFSDDGMLYNVTAALKRTVDQDEHYYLQAMRKIIAGCEQPFHSRKAVFLEIREELHTLNGTEDFPVAAARLFLSDVERGHAIQARDRALTETWSIALALAAGLDRPSFRISPYSGKEYHVVEGATAVTVWTGEPDDGQIVVPYPIGKDGLTPQTPNQKTPVEETYKAQTLKLPAPEPQSARRPAPIAADATPREARRPGSALPLPIRRPVATPRRRTLTSVLPLSPPDVSLPDRP